jgi:spoIIIJ-associated protein
MSVEKTAKTVDEAISEALKELKIGKDEAEIEILDPGSRGILGLGAKPARVVVTKKFDPENKAKSFVREVAAAMGVPVEVTTELSDKHMNVNLSGKDMGVFIGKRGQTLDSLQYLVNLVVNKGDAQYISITLDTENYRQRRKETLESLAYNLAKKVKQTRKNVVLEPMTPNERRIIHAALQNDKMVSTYSEGEEPYRNVVITAKRTGGTGGHFNKPAPSGRRTTEKPNRTAE